MVITDRTKRRIRIGALVDQPTRDHQDRRKPLRPGTRETFAGAGAGQNL
jgi:hypothetical protein